MFVSSILHFLLLLFIIIIFNQSRKSLNRTLNVTLNDEKHEATAAYVISVIYL